MGMNVNAVIHCLKDAKAIDCLDCPYFAERKGSITSCRMKRLDEAREIIEKYQKIEQIMKEDDEDIHPLDRNYYKLARICEVLKDEKDT